MTLTVEVDSDVRPPSHSIFLDGIEKRIAKMAARVPIKLQAHGSFWLKGNNVR